jgi:cell division protein FtsW (lipid II flippase)
MATSNRVPVPRWKREAELVLGRGVNTRPQSGRELPVDKVLLAVVLGITLFGAVMVYSASAILAERNYGSQFYFLSRQALWARWAWRDGGRPVYRLSAPAAVVIYTVLVSSLVLGRGAVSAQSERDSQVGKIRLVFTVTL